MQSIRVLIVRFASLFRKQRLDQDLEDELQAHIELAVEEHQRRGLPAEQARALAVREFGGVTQTRENYRVQRGLPFLESIWHDIA